MEHAPTPQTPPLPNAEALLELERRCRSLGTGLEVERLYGAWELQETWSKGQTLPAAASSWLLRALAAQVKIEAGPRPGDLKLTNRVSLGGLSLQFTGQGQLQGRRPLLVFWFERVQLLLGPVSLLDRALAKPAAAKLPFFALIGRGSEGDRQDPHARQWLAARGRGGGLALWCLPSPGPGAIQPSG